MKPFLDKIIEPRFLRIFYLTFILGIITVISGIGLFIYLISSYDIYVVREIFNPNSLTIEVGSDLDKNKVDVYWGNSLNSSTKIVENGVELDVIYKEYGGITFIVTYENDSIGSFGTFRTSNWRAYNHVIQLNKLEGIVTCTGEISAK